MPADWDHLFRPTPPPLLPSTPFERAQAFRNGLIGRATGGSFDDANYGLLRSEFMGDPATNELLPRFVRTCLDTSDFWSHIQAAFPTYQERRTHLRQAFEPLLTFLELP